SKEPHPPKWTGYQLLALIFGTLLSSQGTDASFVLTLSGFPPGFRSAVLRFRLYQTLSCPISSVLSRFCAFALSLSGDSDSIRDSPPDFPGFGFLDEESSAPHTKLPVGWGCRT
ncbi:hypothetical protein, partial [Streptomyces sp. NPDC057010]|uniref:hypothetical protein n=1 Tax=Streptomyces sp. NPDC057010 TaxID=3345997 RepID=UPI00363BAE0C